MHGHVFAQDAEKFEDGLRGALHAVVGVDHPFGQGARQVRAAMPECVLVFLEPPSPEELKRRLVGRGTEDEAAVRARLERADAELAAVGEFDHVVRNVDVETAASELSALVPKRQM